ncbi:hypothetical protein Bca101_040208 [Brassica carinata]
MAKIINYKDEGPTHRPKTQKLNRRGSKLRHVIFHLYDRPAINEHGSRRGTTSFHRNQKRRRNSADGEDEPRKNQSSQGLEPKSQNWWIYESEKEHRRLQSILQFRLSCMKRSSIFEDEDKLEDAKTKSIGEKNRRSYRARDNRSTKNWIVDGSVPARTILSKTSSPRDRGRRSRRYESHRFPEAKPHDHRRY